MMIKFDVFGRQIAVESSDSGWQVYFLGDEGKRRLARDVLIPSSVTETELEGYLFDVFHESASADHPEVKRLIDKP